MQNSNKAQKPEPEVTETGFSVEKNPATVLLDDKMAFGMTEDGEATIRRVLSSYEIGAKLRQLRLRKKIALVDLGKHTGLSASLLSQLENGKLVPTLPTLARIAMVFDVSLDYFFGDKRRRKPVAVVRAAERMRFPDRAGSVKPNYFFECLAYSAQDKAMQAYLAEFPKRETDDIEEHFHEGSEFIHVLEGSVSVHYQGDDVILKAGDSAFFDASEPHGYRGASRTPAKAIVVTAPPRI